MKLFLNILRIGKGFTLIELMIAISIVAVLATIGFTSFQQSQLRARDARRKQDLRALATSLELYYQRHQHYPCTSNFISSTSGGNWLVNDPTAATGCGDATHAFNSVFINKQPLDPNHPASAYVYFGRGDSYAQCTVATGQGYMLYAQLENPNDPESHGNKPYTICGSTQPGWGSNFFIISDP